MNLGRLPRLPARTVQVVDSRCALAESPLWMPDTAELRWVDAVRGELHTLRPGGHEHRPVAAGVVSAVAAETGGGLVLTVDRQVLRRADGPGGPATVLARIPDRPAGIRFNDAKAGPDGRLWAGTVCPGQPGAAALWSIDPTGETVRHWTGISHGNGIAWSPSGDTMFFVDSGEGTVSRAAFSHSGGVGAREVIARISNGIPDGLTVDAQADLWLAVWGAGCLVRLRADGTPVGRVDLPDRNVTSCAFAGRDLDLLAVTTAADDVDPAGGGGSVYLLDVGRCGIAGYLFGTTAGRSGDH
ncbi:SMP-30/gluconolactonase/LRE family protein [Streptosporangium sp. NBC_01755]|uniref:SMP-30/gluconolactonase/LRE family protein n=1 Tax=unclassified Streptosporangium TaxID=2632669 RepID=UPI002DDA5BBF|nr:MULTISPECIES: SMP-30/gluconolactonase/LRE family protein [unclassified Streptosporangium]WSA24158.1 SMP-30/gluconolactonase/LRE family protein [Streptosporangium sp. NBC_01810]WSC97768.1 SMP-30/gluconolactonase/LRE family protein [Streptosporangium sp. NBC_01755]